MFGIQFSITHKFTRPTVKRHITFVSYAGIGGEIKRSDNDYLSESNSIVINMSLNMANLNTLSLNPKNCSSGFDKKIVEALNAEKEQQLRNLVLCNSNPQLDVTGLKFHEIRRNSVEDICDMDIHTKEISSLTIKVVLTSKDLEELSNRNELYSDILAIIIEFPEATYSERFRDLNGAMRALESQRIARIEEIRKRNEIFAENGNIYNYFLNDPEKRVGVLYVNHLGMVKKIKAVALTYLKKGLYVSLGEGEDFKEMIVEIDEILEGKTISLGVYLTEAQAKTGTNNSEEIVRLGKELDKTQNILKEKFKDITRLTERAEKAEATVSSKDYELKQLKQELLMKELLVKGREQGLKNKEDVIKLKEAEQRHKEITDNSFFGKIKRFFGSLFDIGKSLFGIVDGAVKVKTGAKVLGIG